MISFLKYTVLFLLWVGYLWQQYIRARQYHLTRSVKDPPQEPKYSVQRNLFDKSRKYMLLSKRFAFIKDLFNTIISTIVIVYEILPRIWEEFCPGYHTNEVLQSSVWYMILTTGLSILNLPLTIYETFVVESHNLQRNNFLVWEKLMNFFWSLIGIMVMFPLIASIINRGDWFLIIFWIVFCGCVIVIGVIYPLLPPTKLRRVSRLDVNVLRKKIERLAAHINFPLNEIYVEDRYKESKMNKLYIYGFPREKNIVIEDCLFLGGDVGCTHDEITALVLGEMGRWYYRHTLKYILILAFNLMILFSVFLFLFKNPEVYAVFGFYEIRPTLVGMYVTLKYVMNFLSSILGFFFLYASRQMIFREDEFVVKFGKGEALIRALVKLDNNQTYPVYDPLYSVWHHDKPLLMERIRAIRAAEAKYH